MDRDVPICIFCSSLAIFVHMGARGKEDFLLKMALCDYICDAIDDNNYAVWKSFNVKIKRREAMMTNHTRKEKGGEEDSFEEHF